MLKAREQNFHIPDLTTPPSHPARAVRAAVLKFVLDLIMNRIHDDEAQAKRYLQFMVSVFGRMSDFLTFARLVMILLPLVGDAPDKEYVNDIFIYI